MLTTWNRLAPLACCAALTLALLGCGAPDGASTVKEFGLYKSVVYTKDNVAVHFSNGSPYHEARSDKMRVLSEEELWDYYRAGGELPVRIELRMEWSAVPNVLGAKRLIETVWTSNLRGASQNVKDEYFHINETNRHDVDVHWEKEWTAFGLLNDPLSDGHGRHDIDVQTIIRGLDVDWKAFRVNVYRAF